MTVSKDNHYLHALRRLIDDYAKGYDVKIYLFGSRAKGTEYKTSDVDIAILPLTPLPQGFMAHLKEKIEESTVPYAVDLIDLSQVEAEFRKKILAEAIEWKD